MAEGALECPSCGIIVGKWRGGQAPRLSGQARAPVLHSSKKSSARPIRVAAAGIAGAVLLIGGYWYFSIRPRARAIEDPYYGSNPRSGKTLKQVKSRVQNFDVAFTLPGSPIGAATNGSELIVGNRKDPWGAIRLKAVDKDRISSELVPIIEPGYSQRISLNAITWNGKQYVGLTTGAWFQSVGEVFTVHDRSTLRIAGWKPAPKLVGCLAWDGTSYWAATRRNTADSPEPALLYRIDANFKVVSTSEAPGVGCQGLAWDGRHLWFADVFSDSIHVIDVSGESPRVVHSENTDISYLSGVVSFDGDIWVTDYDKNLLQRLEPGVRVAWAGGAPAPERRPVVAGAAGKDVAALQRQLRSTEWSERMRAEMELQSIGASIDFDRDENRFVDRKPDDTEVIDWSIEVRNGFLYGSWRVWFGPDVFKRGEQSGGVITLPQFARYTVTVQSPGGSKVEKEFEATAGDNVMNDVRLADASASGEYRVDLFLHVQYVDADGKGKILNRNTTGLTVRQ